MVGYAAGDGGKVRVSGGEEVESYVGGEDFGGEGRGEEGGEAGLEDSEGWSDGQSSRNIRSRAMEWAYSSPASKFARQVGAHRWV